MDNNDIIIELQRDEIIEELVNKSGCKDEEIKGIIDNIITFTPPQRSKTSQLQMLTIKKNLELTKSVKPGNIIVNWKKFIDILPDVIAVIQGSKLNIILMVLNLFKMLKVNLSEREGLVVLAIIECNSCCNLFIGEDIVKAKFHKLANELSICVKEGDFESACDSLKKVNCINISDGKICLLEKYKIDKI